MERDFTEHTAILPNFPLTILLYLQLATVPLIRGCWDKLEDAMQWLLSTCSWEGYSELFNTPTNTELFQKYARQGASARYILFDRSIVYVHRYLEEDLKYYGLKQGFATLWYENADDTRFAYNLGVTLSIPYKREVETRYRNLLRWAQEEEAEHARWKEEWEERERQLAANE